MRARLRLVALEELLADHHLLDLGRPLADQEQRRVAVDPLDLVLLRIPVAAVDAKRLLGVRLGRLRGEQLRHPGLEVGPLAGVLHAGRFEGQQASRLEPGAHLGELEGDRLVLGDRLAERLALLAVAQREPHPALGDADPARGATPIVRAATFIRPTSIGSIIWMNPWPRPSGPPRIRSSPTLKPSKTS